MKIKTVSTKEPVPRPMRIAARKTGGGPDVDGVSDALQRYLNIEPRHEVTADTHNEAAQPILAAGPPNFVDDPYFDPAYAAQNAMNRLQEVLNKPAMPIIAVGPTPLSERPGQNPRYAYAVAMNAMRQEEDFRLATQVLGGVA